MLGDRRGGERGLPAEQGGLVRGGDHDDRTCQALGTEVTLDELPHLAPTLADERDDVDRGGGMTRQAAEEHALADSAPREDAGALAAPDRQESVEDAQAGLERLSDPPAFHDGWWKAMDRSLRGGGNRAAPVERTAEAVHDAAEQRLADGGGLRTPRRPHRSAGTDARDLAEWHQHQAPLTKPDDLRGDRLRDVDHAHVPDRCLEATDLGGEAEHSRDLSHPPGEIHAPKARGGRLELRGGTHAA